MTARSGGYGNGKAVPLSISELGVVDLLRSTRIPREFLDCVAANNGSLAQFVDYGQGYNSDPIFLRTFRTFSGSFNAHCPTRCHISDPVQPKPRFLGSHPHQRKLWERPCAFIRHVRTRATKDHDKGWIRSWES